MFNVFFMVRRTLFVVIIIEMNDLSGMQLIFNSYLSMAMIIYVAHYRPYKKPTANNWEIFNEVCGFFVIYFLKWLAVLPPFDVSELGIIETIGWCYIFAVSFNIFVNIVFFGYQQGKKIPFWCRKTQSDLSHQKYIQWKKSYIKQKMSINENNATRIQLVFQLEATKIDA